MEHFYFLGGFLILGLGALAGLVKTNRLRYRFKFSVKNYYLLVAVFLIYPITWALLDHSWRPILLFLVFAPAGIVMETLIAEWWRIFYVKDFWDYRVEVLVGGYSSWLNLIPWGVGGLLYLTVLKFFSGQSLAGLQAHAVGGSLALFPFYVIFVIVMLTGIALQLAIWNVLGASGRFKKVTLANYLYFVFPILLAWGALVCIYGRQFVYIGLAFGLLAAGAEYCLGKGIEFMISKKLWVYNHLAFDRGHFTPLSVIPFVFAGFYFWGIALALQQFR